MTKQTVYCDLCHDPIEGEYLHVDSSAGCGVNETHPIDACYWCLLNIATHEIGRISAQDIEDAGNWQWEIDARPESKIMIAERN